METVESDKPAVVNKDKVVVKTEGRAPDEECPIARNAALLEELDIAEGKVAELLEVAAEALDELSGIESVDRSKVEASTKRFLGLVSSLHSTLSSKSTLIRDYTPYPRSIYGPRKELEILHEKARFLRATLADVSNPRQPRQQQRAEAHPSPVDAPPTAAMTRPLREKSPSTATTATTTTAPATASTAASVSPRVVPSTAVAPPPPDPTPDLQATAGGVSGGGSQ